MKYDFSNIVDCTKAIERLNFLIKGEKKVELKEVRKSRTVSQNAYLHVAITLYAINFGYTIEEAKTDLKRGCSFMVYEKNGKKYLKRTRDMDTKELTSFIEWIRNYSSLNGFYIPSSEEYLTNKFNIDREIDNHKQYL